MIEMDCFVLQPGELVIVKDYYFKGRAVGICIDLGVSSMETRSLFHRFDELYYQTEYTFLINNDIFFVSEDELLNGLDEGWVEVLPA